MSLLLQDPVTADAEEARAETTVDVVKAKLLFEEARRRRRRRLFVLGIVLAGFLCLGVTLIAAGGGRLFGGPPTASGKGPTGGATIQKSPPQSHDQRTPTTPRPSICNKGIFPNGVKTVHPPESKGSISLLPCNYPLRTNPLNGPTGT
jgi:hypothetical protein